MNQDTSHEKEPVAPTPEDYAGACFSAPPHCRSVSVAFRLVQAEAQSPGPDGGVR